MARIVFSLFSNINWLDNQAIDPFYAGFVESLVQHGNEVMLIRTNDFLSNINDNALFHYIQSTKLEKKVKDFNPDFIIAANNHVPEVILKALDCPIFIWTSDSPVWYSSKDFIKKNIKRYKFFHQGWDNPHTKACMNEFAAKADQNFCVGYATMLRSKPEPIKSNITFIGTIGYPDNLRNYLKYICDNAGLEKLRNFYEKIKEAPFDYMKTDLKQEPVKISDYFYALTSNNRIKTLDNISDLGLKVFGYPHNFFEVVPYSMDLAFCFDYTPVITIDYTEKLLNSSKIGVNLYHTQAVTGFSWRVADIMASNACLISPNKADLVKFSPYIKMPTFETPQEARELCQKLLRDEAWRNDIVAASNKAIEEHGRFEHLFKTMQEILNVNLLNNTLDASKNYLIILKYEDYLNIANATLFTVSQKLQKAHFMRGVIIKIAKLIPKPILRRVYYFLLSIRDYVK